MPFVNFLMVDVRKVIFISAPNVVALIVKLLVIIGPRPIRIIIQLNLNHYIRILLVSILVLLLCILQIKV